jgi:hypothetical protein
LNRSVLFRTDVCFLVANPGPNQSETALFGIASATMLSKRVPDRSPFWTDRFCSKRMCAFWRPARGPTNPKQLFLNRFGNDAFQTGSGPEPFLHRSVLFKTDVCSFATSPRPNQSETCFLNRFGNDAFQTGSGPGPLLNRSVLFKTDVCFLVTTSGTNHCETCFFKSLRQRCFPTVLWTGAFLEPIGSVQSRYRFLCDRPGAFLGSMLAEAIRK